MPPTTATRRRTQRRQLRQPVMTWTGDLALAGTATITYSVTVYNPDTGDKPWPTPSPPPTRAAPAPRQRRPRLRGHHPRAHPRADHREDRPRHRHPRAHVTYTITVTNTGQTPYTGATFTDDLTGVLDDATYNGDAAVTGGTVT